MDICALIKEIENRKFFLGQNNFTFYDNLSELLDASQREDVFYVGINLTVTEYFRNNPNSNWKIKAIFQIGFPFFFNGPGETKENNFIGESLQDEYWSLFVFTKSDCQNVFIGFNDVFRFAFRDQVYIDFANMPNTDDDKYKGKLLFNPIYNNTFYFEQINFVLTNNEIPEITEEIYRRYSISFSSVPRENFFIKYLDCLSRYKQSVIDDFDLPQKDEKLLELKHLVQIVCKDTSQEKIIPKERDIVTNGLYMDEYSNSLDGFIKIATNDENKKYSFVFRSLSASPFFIWALLNSEFAKDYCLSTKEYFELNTSPIEMDDILCFVPKIINESYFQKKYEMVKQTKLTLHKKLENDKDSIFFDKDAKQIILKDLNELKSCFEVKAYKAAIILAGSILEAFLIDWLSEIDGKNYFKENLMVYDKHLGIEKRADLIDYIDRMQYLKQACWNDAAKKATEIRRKRNLIHAKLYINDSDISKETCTEVIQYLESVIKTRW